MTKTMKHASFLLAFVAAAILALAMSAGLAFAAGTGSITMDTSADGTVAATGKTFKAYKVLDVSYSGDNYSYTIPAEPAALKTKLAEKFKVTKGTMTDIAFEQAIVAAIEAAANSNVEQTAKDLLAVAKAANLTAIEIQGNTAKTGLDLGYYVIEDVTSSGDNQKPVSAVALTTTNPSQTIKVKATKPTLEKKIDEGTADATQDADAIEAGNGQLDSVDPSYDNHRVGDEVPYVLKTTVPEMTGYTKYFFVVNDTLSKGLTFNDDVVVKVTKAAIEDDPATTEVDESADAVTRTLEKGVDYTVASTVNQTTGETAVEIVFKDFYNKEKDHAGEEVIITYSATINKDAVIGVEGNPNTATLTYSNNPNDTQEGTPENPNKPTPGSATGVTPQQKTYTYVTGLKLKKVDPEGNDLSGATFELSGNLNKVEVYTSEKFEQTADGTYYGLLDGTFTKTAPVTDPEADGFNADKYEGWDADTETLTAVMYKKVTVTATEATAAGDPKKVSATTNENGVVIFDGMGNGAFTLTETAAPTGYNPLTAPIEFTVNWTAPEDPATSTNCTWAVSNVTSGYNVTFNADEGEFIITVENQSGTVLPSTGGMGTTILYIVGAVLVIGAGIFLITKRRVRKESDFQA